MEPLKDKEKVSEIFCHVVEIFGLSLLEETHRLNAVLMDFMPQYEKERKLLLEAVKLGAARDLLSVKGKSDVDISSVSTRCKCYMEKELFIKESVAEYTIDLLVSALKIVPTRNVVFITISEEKARKGGIQEFRINYNQKKYLYSINIPAGVRDGEKIEIVQPLPGRSETGTLQVNIAVKREENSERIFLNHNHHMEEETMNMSYIYHKILISRELAQRGGRQEIIINKFGDDHHYFVNIPAGIRSGTNIDIHQILPGSSNMGTIRVHVIVK